MDYFCALLRALKITSIGDYWMTFSCQISHTSLIIRRAHKNKENTTPSIHSLFSNSLITVRGSKRGSSFLPSLSSSLSSVHKQS